jgi:hypothetical protein
MTDQVASGETQNVAIETAAIETPVIEAKSEPTTLLDEVEVKAEPAEIKEVEGAPDAYELKASEGRQFDPQVLEAYTEVARELNLSNDNAQKLLDKVAPIMAERQQAQLDAIRSDWEQSSKADKEFGGERLTENLGIAKKALDAFGTDELKSLLKESGLGNNPEVIRFMYRAGQNISEDKFIGGQAPPASGKTFADKLYS